MSIEISARKVYDSVDLSWLKSPEDVPFYKYCPKINIASKKTFGRCVLRLLLGNLQVHLSKKSDVSNLMLMITCYDKDKELRIYSMKFFDALKINTQTHSLDMCKYIKLEKYIVYQK